jgi:hypothetical protein
VHIENGLVKAIAQKPERTSGVSIDPEKMLEIRFASARSVVLAEIRNAIAPDFAAIRARRAAVVELGWAPGEPCNRDNCEGVIELDPVVDCSCHLSPPCWAHENQAAVCPVCDWRSDEGAA